jgi:meiotically up-regulated gene 157 (Mug157) protein
MKPGVRKLLTRFMAAVSLSGALAAQPVAADPILPDVDRLVAQADSAAAPYLTPQERQTFKAMFQQALTGIDKHLVMARDGTAYIETGDIPAEWLRDSSAQIRPYLFFARDDKAVADKIKAVIERQAMYIARDPYANAFGDDFSIWEKKYSLDSLSSPILLAWSYWKVTGDATVFTPAVKESFRRALDVMLTEQDHEGSQPGRKPSTYRFRSNFETSDLRPVAYTGMIWTAFRPSDDACTYNFLIPAEMQAVEALKAMNEMETFIGRGEQARKAQTLADEVKAGIERYGIADVPGIGRIYAYEVDGFGRVNLMDDANVPSLLSAPYTGYPVDGDVYAATRRFILSDANPTYFTGTTVNGQKMSGVGSPHFLSYTRGNIWVQGSMLANPVPPNMIWPLAQVMQGLTATDRTEQFNVLKMILASDPGDHRLHESFFPDDPTIFTRSDFGWPNALFAEFVLTTVMGRQPLPVPTGPISQPLIATAKPAQAQPG